MTAARPATAGRLLVVDPAAGAAAPAEVGAYAELGFRPVVNLRRVTEPDVRTELADRWPCVDVDGFDTDALAAALEAEDGCTAIKCRAGLPLTRRVVERVTASSLAEPLRVVGRAATGVDSFDHDALAAHDVAVLSTPGANAGAVAELTLGMIIAGLRGLAQRSAALHRGSWSDAVAGLPARGLGDVRVGLIGTGPIARRVATVLAGLGTEVRVVGSPRFTAARAADWPALRVEALTDLVQSCDVVSLHVPATAETERLIDAAVLARMRPGAGLVNTARGRVLDEAALDAALRDPAAPVAWAALDVFDREGASYDSVLAGNPHCLLTPHLAGMTRSAMATASQQLLRAFADWLAAPDGPIS